MPYLSAQEVAKAFRNGRKLQYNAKFEDDVDEAGWVSFQGDADDLVRMLADDFCYFRLESRFKVGDFALLRSIDGGPRYAKAFSKHPGALYVRVLQCYGDGTYYVTNGTCEQAVRNEDRNPA